MSKKVICYGCHYLTPIIFEFKEIGQEIHPSERFLKISIAEYPHYHTKKEYKINFRYIEELIQALKDIRGNDYVTTQLGQGN
jgi:hypothetical protein